jgi:hypothetical protein
MGNQTLLNAAPSLEASGWKNKAENWLVSQFPKQIEAGWYDTIQVGRNDDASPGGRPGYRVRGAGVQNSALYLDVPDHMIPDEILALPELRERTIETRVDKSVASIATDAVSKLVAQGRTLDEAKAQVADSVSKIGYFDPQSGRYVVEPVVRGVHDSILTGMQTPYWNVSRINKIFRRPFLKGQAEHLIHKIGVPNIWADLVQIFVESFEGMARVSAAAHTTGEMNTSIGVKNRTSTMLSDIINLVIDYESASPNESIIGSQEGNWLTGTVIGDRDAYANLMLEQLMTVLYYFGHPETGFKGLAQIADRDDAYDYYPDDRPTAAYLWDHDGAGSGTPVNTTVGADLLLMLSHLIADKMEELHFLPVTIRMSCAPTLWKALSFSMTSKLYNQNSPLSIINTAFASQDKVVGTFATNSGTSLWANFELVPDVMLSPMTPFNQTDEDLMFITFPSLQSAFGEGMTDLVMAPVPIDKMILPSAPGYRDGVVRTALKRIGSLLCPVRKTVHVISGMGTNSRYTP